jgi:ferric-dicitrate binding protein FerR (iron transport regulator)
LNAVPTARTATPRPSPAPLSALSFLAGKSSRSDLTATLSAGQRTVVPATATMGEFLPRVETLAPVEIDRTLAWQTSRFNFDATPLSEVASRLNRYMAESAGAPQLILQDPQLGAILISGRFRSDNVESFIEALETSFGIVAERRANGQIVLRPSAEK